MENKEIVGYGGWAVALIGGIVTIIRVFIDYRKKKLDVHTTLALDKNKNNQTERQELLEQNQILQREIKEVRNELDELKSILVEAKSALNVLYPFLKKLSVNDPELKEAMEIAFKPLHEKQNIS